ncbi:hypothetical protein [Bradyrhizobium sp. CCBAU 51753]|uniref:hypothetical protein n=1 Tax=Bradyrhizobium sp. CCBAU 51753 TaxID=1325100 RepID=UPI00188CBB57|nr:hypothetical protein [Bradyrhizobium sp. CCBAU 51753]
MPSGAQIAGSVPVLFCCTTEGQRIISIGRHKIAYDDDGGMPVQLQATAGEKVSTSAPSRS